MYDGVVFLKRVQYRNDVPIVCLRQVYIIYDLEEELWLFSMARKSMKQQRNFCKRYFAEKQWKPEVVFVLFYNQSKVAYPIA